MKGKFIVIYGVNNLGKTTQAKLLVKKLRSRGQKAEYLKYPIYSLKPTGEIINDYLRGNNRYRLSPREAQIIYALNRGQFEKELTKKLSAGINIVAEDYTGTGLAWGLAYGVKENFLARLNSGLLKEDLAFLLDGQRFLASREKKHLHENDGKIFEKIRKIHLKLARGYGWKIINANQTVKKVQRDIWDKLPKKLRA